MNKYYKISEKIDLDDLDIPNNKDHTMSSNLDKYINSKLPVDNLRIYLPMVKRLEIHGIYPDINIIKKLDLDFEIVEIIAKSNLKKDNSNSIRPIFLLAKRNSELFLVCCVTPGADLLRHYSSMLGFFLREYSGVSLLVLSYPTAEQTIDTWSGLDDKFVRQNDIVILGYSTFFKRSFEKDLTYSRVSSRANSFYD